MKIISFEQKEYSIPFSREFRTSKGILTNRRGIIVIAKSDSGITGLGEIAPLDNYSVESLSDARQYITQFFDKITGMEIPSDITILADATRAINDSGHYPSSVLFGVETAIADLAAKASGLALCRWINRTSFYKVPVNAVLSCNINSMEEEIKSLSAFGYMAFKIKVGSQSIDENIARTAMLRNLLGNDVAIRLDANRAWDFNSAAAILKHLGEFDIEYIEEPLRRSEIERLPELHAATDVNFALDETVQDMRLWEQLLESDAVYAVVIKPTIAGGLTRSIALANYARARGGKVVVTSTFESGIGVAACLHLAASLDDNILPCGLDTTRYLADVVVREGFPVIDGCMNLTDSPGLGVTLKG